MTRFQIRLTTQTIPPMNVGFLLSGILKRVSCYLFRTPTTAKQFASLVRENRHAENENRMNKDKTENLEDEMRLEYDLSQLKGRVRGKYVDRYRAGTNLVLLESDVQAAFPDAEAVNEALRMLMKVARRQVQEQV